MEFSYNFEVNIVSLGIKIDVGYHIFKNNYFIKIDYYALKLKEFNFVKGYWLRPPHKHTCLSITCQNNFNLQKRERFHHFDSPTFS